MHYSPIESYILIACCTSDSRRAKNKSNQVEADRNLVPI